MKNLGKYLVIFIYFFLGFNTKAISQNIKKEIKLYKNGIECYIDNNIEIIIKYSNSLIRLKTDKNIINIDSITLDSAKCCFLVIDTIPVHISKSILTSELDCLIEIDILTKKNLKKKENNIKYKTVFYHFDWVIYNINWSKHSAATYIKFCMSTQVSFIFKNMNNTKCEYHSPF